MELTGQIAHRGLSAEAPENTHSAFLAAHRRGFRWCETDVTLLGDNTPVLSHDYDLGRCCQLTTGCLGDYRLDSYQRLDVGSWFSPRFAGQRLPLLSDFFRWMDDWQMGVNLELKVEWSNLAIWEPLVQAVVATMQAQNFPLERVVISSFALPLLYRCRQLCPHVRLGYLLAQPDRAWPQHAEALGLYSLHVADGMLSESDLDACHRRAMKFLVYTVNDADRQQTLFDLGVDGLFTDVATEGR